MTAKTEIKDFIKSQNELETLRFITCGSVDDGKSTLLGRMLYEAKLIFDDQVDNLIKDSKKNGTQDGEIDFALLVDGLAAEREQGITIDVAYRYFSTENRKFIVADSPGHEQYTRNMVTAASNAELAIILIDARNGLMPQTKRHSFIANLVGIKKIIVAVNKMDLINYNKDTFNRIVQNYKDDVLSTLNFHDVDFIPVAALTGENIVRNSKKMSWYHGKSLMTILETSKLKDKVSKSFSLPIQYVNRPNLDFRGYCGTVSTGSLKSGDSIIVSSSEQKAKINEIYIGNKKVSKCSAGDAVTITLDKEIDISRGDLLYKNSPGLKKNKAFLSSLIWFSDKKCFSNRSYLLKTANNLMSCEIVKIKNKININSFEKISTGSLSMNDIAECEILLDHDSFLLPFDTNQTLGNFILIDKQTNLTVAAGIIKHHLRRSANIKWQDTEINREARLDILGQKSFLIWFTGLSGAGKSTIANLVEKKLASDRKATYLLDGDNLRHGLNKDLGFKKEDRIENLRRVGEVAKILYDSGIIVLASFISPYAKDRQKIRDLFPVDDFVEVYVEASLKNLKSRDPKGLYAKAERNEIPNFTGISSDYEPPSNPEIHINTDEKSAEESAEEVLRYILKHVFRK